VHIITTTSGTQATLTVSNSGPLVAEDEIPRLFQPFQRLSPDRNGSHDGYGLGLAITYAVAKAHHAALNTRTQPEGGLSIDVHFPTTFEPATEPTREPANPRKRTLPCPKTLTENVAKSRSQDDFKRRVGVTVYPTSNLDSLAAASAPESAEFVRRCGAVRWRPVRPLTPECSPCDGSPWPPPRDFQ
jgi:hypothetical protein